MYYVAAEEIEWNYGSAMDHSSMDGIAGAHGAVEGQMDMASAEPAAMEPGAVDAVTSTTTWMLG